MCDRKQLVIFARLKRINGNLFKAINASLIGAIYVQHVGSHLMDIYSRIDLEPSQCHVMDRSTASYI